MLEKLPSDDVQVVTSYVTVQPDLSSTLTPTTSGDKAPVVGPSAGNSASDAIPPQPTSGPSPGNNKRSAGSSLIELELRDEEEDGNGNNGPPPCQPGDTSPNCMPGGNNGPGPGQGQKSKGVSPPPAVVQWMQCFFWAIELAWLIIPQTVSWCMRRCRKDVTVECNGCCEKHCKKSSFDADPEPDDQDEKKPAVTPEKSKKGPLTTVERRADSIKHVGEGFKYIFSLISKLMQSIGTQKGGPCPGPPPCN